MIRALSFVLLLAAAPLALAEESATTSRSTELKDQGSADARTLTTLREGTAVKVMQRSGGWAKVEAGGQTGWIRVFHLRMAATVETGSSSGAGSALSGLGSFFGGSRNTSGKTTIATTGIRGLSPEDLKNATPDPEALKRMQSYRADKASAERFAREGKLAETRVDLEGGRR
jgi:uncharacterized protein YgiM (DUF1202 family)